MIEDFDDYYLEELVERLEEIKENGQGELSFPNALYCLAKEIENIKQLLEKIYHD